MTEAQARSGLKQGLMHIYCGNGKGKTTACIGLAVRAASHNLSVLFCQFLKSGRSGELSILETIPWIEVESGMPATGFSWTMTDDEKAEVRRCHNERLDWVRAGMKAGRWDLVILDEIIGTIDAGLADVDRLMALIKDKPETCELVLSGRQPTPEMVAYADYVSCIEPQKHPYETSGISARKGIEF